jgi:hypothetical protein
MAYCRILIQNTALNNFNIFTDSYVSGTVGSISVQIASLDLLQLQSLIVS